LTICYENIASFPYQFDVLGPCTDAETSSYAYLTDDSLPAWLTFTSDATNSMQIINILEAVDFGTGN